jgi:hypothetical protein
MVQAGWYYDPSIENPDGTTCAYCSLSLDAWDAGDEPTEEHRKRSSDCLFFTLKDLYHPVEKPKLTRGKRVSSRSSTGSKKGTKTARTKKNAIKEDLNKPLPLPPIETGIETFAESFAESFAVGDSFATSVTSMPGKASTRGRKTKRAAVLTEAPTEVRVESYAIGESFAESVASQPAKRGRKPKKAPIPEPVMAESFVESLADSIASVPAKAPAAKGRKTKQTAKRASTVSVASNARSTRRNKRTSDEMMDADDEAVIPLVPSPKRPRISDISSNMILDESTPINTPQTYPQPSVSLPVQSPSPATPPQPQTPGLSTTPRTTVKWDPINVDDLFENRDIFGIVSNVIVDSGLDKENLDIDMKDTPENITQAVKAGLTSPEKKMSIEEWVMYNAKRGAEKLKMECERQIAAFESEGRRALTALDAY